jgi:hypothetical protein
MAKPIKEIIPEIVRKLLIQRKDYLRQQRINRHKKNRNPNQPRLPGMKEGGQMAITKHTTMKEFSKGKRLKPGIRLKGGKSFIKEYKRRLQRKAGGGVVKAAGGTKRVPGSGAATKGTNFEGIF